MNAAFVNFRADVPAALRLACKIKPPYRLGNASRFDSRRMRRKFKVPIGELEERLNG